MNDAISRSTLQKEFDEKCIHDCEFCPWYLHWVTEDLEREGTCVLIQKAAAIDAVPVVHARWKIECDLHVDYYGETDEEFFIECPLCGRREYNINQFKAMDGNYEETTKEYPYCHCGARMDGDPDG